MFAVRSSIQPRQFRICDDIAFLCFVYVREAMWTSFMHQKNIIIVKQFDGRMDVYMKWGGRMVG